MSQWFAGARLGIRHKTTNYEYIDSLSSTNEYPKRTDFSISPRVGYYVNERLQTGLGLVYGYAYGDSRNTYPNGGNKNKYISREYGIQPFITYHYLIKGRFLFGLEGTAKISHKNGESRYSELSFTDFIFYIAENKTKSLETGFNISPLVQFKCSDRILLECRLDFLSLGYNYSIIKYSVKRDSGEKEDRFKEKSHTVNAIFNGDEFFRLGNLTVGAVFRW